MNGQKDVSGRVGDGDPSWNGRAKWTSLAQRSWGGLKYKQTAGGNGEGKGVQCQLARRHDNQKNPQIPV